MNAVIVCPCCNELHPFTRSNIDPHKNMMCQGCEYELPGEAFDRIAALESDLRAARAELEAATGRADALEAELKQPISDTALRKRNDGYLPVGNGCMLVTSEEWNELTALRRQIDGAETINLRDGEMGKITTYKLLEVKP